MYIPLALDRARVILSMAPDTSIGWRNFKMVFSESTAPQSVSVGLEALNNVLYHGALRLLNDV